jgi:hypothetical protein
MALISLPSKVHFEKVEKLQLLRAGATIRSKYTGSRQTIVHPFAIWVFQGTLIPVEGADAGEWRSFLTKLEGQKHTFQLPVPGVEAPLSGYQGVLSTSATALARATSISVTGTANALALKEGDYFTINGELKIATAPVQLNGTGAGTISFQPGLRKPLTATGLVLTLNNPYCVMSAADDEAATWGLERPVRHGIKLSAIEAF